MNFPLLKIAIVLSGLTFLGCSTERVRPQKTVLHPVVSKVATSRMNEGARKINRMTPIFYGKNVIVGNGIDGISSVNSWGRTQWQTVITNGVEASSVLQGSTLYVPANDGFIYKLNADDGKIIGQVRTGSENLGELSLSGDGKTLYAQNSLGSVFSINVDTLKINWTFSRSDSQPSTIRGTSKVTWHKNRVYFGISDGTLLALDASAGQVIWEKSLNRNKKFRDIDASPLIEGDKIYVSAYDEMVYCLDLIGQILWQANYGGYGAPSLFENLLIVPSNQSQVVALDKSTGNLKWSFKTKSIPTEVKAIKGYGVFGDSAGPLYLLDLRQGKEISNFEPGRGIFSSPAVSADHDLVAFVSGEAVLYVTQIRREIKD
ncbi:MAG: PQQ-binding-like beta-propeller repeat protein [Bdellovibrionota bacterium]